MSVRLCDGGGDLKNKTETHELTGPLINVNITWFRISDYKSDTVVLKLRSPDLEKQHHLGTCYKCTISVYTPDTCNWSATMGQSPTMCALISLPGNSHIH